MSTDCGKKEPVKESSYHQKVNVLSSEVSELHETITRLTDKFDAVLPPGKPTDESEAGDKEPCGCAPIESFLDEAAMKVRAAHSRLRDIIDRCVL